MYRFIPQLILGVIACLFATPGFAQTESNQENKASVPPNGQTAKQESDAANELILNAADNLRRKDKYQLSYQLKKGEKIRWSVEHIVSTRTKIANKSEDASTRSKSIKVWTVDRIDSIGNMTFLHSIESVDMWHQIGENDPVSFDSKSTTDVPVEYQSVVEKIGKPLATITINPHGQVLDRKSALKQARFGAGDITIPLPKDPIAIGYQWYVPSKLAGTDENSRRVELNSRIHYTLANVKGHNAYISFRTEVLTPIESDKVRSQIMQQMTKGYLVFDMKQGRPIRKEVEWDEKVHGYEGPDSFLSYSAKLSEKMLLAEATPLSPVTPEKKVSALDKKDQPPTIRK